MKFLADENVPQSIIAFFRSKGHDVIDIKEVGSRGRADSEIGEQAIAEKRTIVTFDKDFLLPLTQFAKASVIVLHFPRMKPLSMIPWIDQLLIRLESHPPGGPYQLILRRESIEVVQ